MYSERHDDILEDDSYESEEESESQDSDNQYSDYEDDGDSDESVEVTYWKDPHTSAMYEVLYDHEREQC